MRGVGEGLFPSLLCETSHPSASIGENAQVPDSRHVYVSYRNDRIRPIRGHCSVHITIAMSFGPWKFETIRSPGRALLQQVAHSPHDFPDDGHCSLPSNLSHTSA
jgi:hypothetical protein